MCVLACAGNCVALRCTQYQGALLLHWLAINWQPRSPNNARAECSLDIFEPPLGRELRAILGGLQGSCDALLGRRYYVRKQAKLDLQIAREKVGGGWGWPGACVGGG